MAAPYTSVKPFMDYKPPQTAAQAATAAAAVAAGAAAAGAAAAPAAHRPGELSEQHPRAHPEPKDTPFEEEEDAARAEDDDDEGCGFCRFMKGGGCREEFAAWSACVDRERGEGSDFAEACRGATAALRECMLAHADYYAPLLEEEEAAMAAAAEAAAEGAGGAAAGEGAGGEDAGPAAEGTGAGGEGA